MNETYNVVGLCYDPAWLRSNAEDPVMPIIVGVPLDKARTHHANLSMLAPGTDFEIRDGSGNVVPVNAEPSVTPHEARVMRARRALGPRGL